MLPASKNAVYYLETGTAAGLDDVHAGTTAAIAFTFVFNGDGDLA